jgi:hypothetical protein
MINQVETATVIGDIILSGNAKVIVTAARMSGSPITVSVSVVALDSASIVAVKIKSVLALNTVIGGFFSVSGTGADVVLTTRLPAPNDTTLNINIDNDTCTGLTDAPLSADTTAGEGIESGYATLDEYKTWIAVRGLDGAVGTDTSDDSVIEILIEAASRYIDRETGQRFYLNAADETRYYTPEDGDAFSIDIDPLGSLTSISVDYSGTRSYTALTATDYDLLPINAALDEIPYTCIEINSMLSTAYFPHYKKSVQVIGKFGYPECPMEVKEACLSIAQSLNGSRSGQTSGGNVTVTAAGVVIRPQDVPAFAQQIIKGYRSLT